jgi:hypothetical protein
MDKLLQSFGADVLQVLFNTAGRVSICLPERLPAETVRLLLDQGVATACYDILPKRPSPEHLCAVHICTRFV